MTFFTTRQGDGAAMFSLRLHDDSRLEWEWLPGRVLLVSRWLPANIHGTNAAMLSACSQLYGEELQRFLAFVQAGGGDLE